MEPRPPRRFQRPAPQRLLRPQRRRPSNRFARLEGLNYFPEPGARIPGFVFKSGHPMKKHFRILGGILAVWLVCAPFANAQPRNDQVIRAPKPYTAKEADDYLDGFRRAWLLSDLGLKFDFLHRPRRGEETRFTGQGWTSMNQGYPVTRF